MRRAPVHWILAVWLVGCGGGEEELTCEFLANPENCWADAAAAVRACLPADPEIAVFESDRRSCGFSDGTRVVFDETLPQFVEDISQELEDLGFIIEKDGETCGRFVDRLENRMEMEAGELSAVAELHSNRDFHVHCGDGSTLSANFDRIFDCAAEGIPGPTDGFDLEPTFVSFSISSVTTPGELFRCETP